MRFQSARLLPRAQEPGLARHAAADGAPDADSRCAAISLARRARRRHDAASSGASPAAEMRRSHLFTSPRKTPPLDAMASPISAAMLTPGRRCTYAGARARQAGMPLMRELS